MYTKLYRPGSCCETGCDCTTSTNINCCGCSDTPNDNCPGGDDGSNEKITDNSGSGKCKTKKTEASEDGEFFLAIDEEEGQSCDCNTDDQCDEDENEECIQMNKCGGTDKYEFEE